MPPLLKGVLYENYCHHVLSVLAHEGLNLTEHEQLDIVRKATQTVPEIAVRIDSALGRKDIVTVRDYLQELSILFLPNVLAFRDALKAKRQRPNQSAADYLN
jgi:hypothetical protein